MHCTNTVYYICSRRYAVVGFLRGDARAIDIVLTSLARFAGATLPAASPLPRSLQSCPTKVLGGYYLGGYSGPLVLQPENLNPSLLTHAIYAFLTMDAQYNVVPADGPSELSLIQRFVSTVKASSPCTKPMFVLGGSAWSAAAGYAIWRSLVATPTARATGISNLIAFARQHSFEGIDLVCGAR